MKEIAASLFDVIALSLPCGLGFGDNPPVGAWLSVDDKACAVLTQSGRSGAYGALIMRRRVDEVWCVIRKEDHSLTKMQAMDVIHEQLEKQSIPIPLPPGVRRRAPLWDTRNVKPSKILAMSVLGVGPIALAPVAASVWALTAGEIVRYNAASQGSWEDISWRRRGSVPSTFSGDYRRR